EVTLLATYQLMKNESIAFDVGLESMFESLHKLQSGKYCEVIRTLCEESIIADINATQKWLTTKEKPAIQYAALIGDKTSVLSSIVCRNNKSRFNRTALHLAVRNKQYEIIESLVLKRADCCTFNESWETCMHYAFQEFLLCCGSRKEGSISECKAAVMLNNCPYLEIVWNSIPANVPKCVQIAVAIFLVTHGNASVSLTSKETNYCKLIALLGERFTSIIVYLNKQDENRGKRVAKRERNKTKDAFCDTSDLKLNENGLENKPSHVSCHTSLPNCNETNLLMSYFRTAHEQLIEKITKIFDEITLLKQTQINFGNYFLNESCSHCSKSTETICNMEEMIEELKVKLNGFEENDNLKTKIEEVTSHDEK
ncbi:hypothetical protein B4U80_14385, partial [Leptotrombidium deliense]